MPVAESTGNRRKDLFLDVLYDIVGCSIFSASIQCFSSPNNIAPGGVSGLSILIQYVTGIPISLMSFALNIPLLLLAWRFLGKRFTLRTLRTVVIMTGTLALAQRIVVPYHGEMILAALFGGVMEGIGLGVVFMRGSTTGGTDIASRLIQLRYPHISIGRLMLLVDGCVLMASAVVYRNIENALYGMVTIFASTRIIDSILYGLDTGKALLVVSDHADTIAGEISTHLDRGSTILSARGSYTGQDKPVLLCAVRKNQYHRLKQIVYLVDPTAFVLALDASEVIGEGFRSHKTAE